MDMDRRGGMSAGGRIDQTPYYMMMMITILEVEVAPTSILTQ